MSDKKPETKAPRLRMVSVAELRVLMGEDDDGDFVVSLPAKKPRKLTKYEKLLAAAAASQHP